MVLPWWFSGKESACQFRRHRFDPWMWKIPWKREWPPTPVFLPGKSHGQRSLAGYSPWSHKWVRHVLVTNTTTSIYNTLLMTLVPMLNTSSPELIHLIQFVPLDQHLSISSIWVPGNPSTIYFSEFDTPTPRFFFFFKIPHISENLSFSDLFHLGKKMPWGPSMAWLLIYF